MDYQHAAYFAGAQQYPPFIGIPPLTPAHSNSVASDDFNGPSSSPLRRTRVASRTASHPLPEQDVFDQLMPNTLNNHDHYANYDQFAAFTAPQPSFPRPPTPPSQAAAVHPVKRQLIQPPAPPQSNILSLPERLPIEEPEDATQNPRQGSTEDEDLTPAQSRRKAQNRAA